LTLLITCKIKYFNFGDHDRPTGKKYLRCCNTLGITLNPDIGNDVMPTLMVSAPRHGEEGRQRGPHHGDVDRAQVRRALEDILNNFFAGSFWIFAYFFKITMPLSHSGSPCSETKFKK
jgi:hypothetical protein